MELAVLLGLKIKVRVFGPAELFVVVPINRHLSHLKSSKNIAELYVLARIQSIRFWRVQKVCK